jgi:hypothetical protein
MAHLSIRVKTIIIINKRTEKNLQPLFKVDILDQRSAGEVCYQLLTSAPTYPIPSLDCLPDCLPDCLTA